MQQLVNKENTPIQQYQDYLHKLYPTQRHYRTDDEYWESQARKSVISLWIPDIARSGNQAEINPDIIADTFFGNGITESHHRTGSRIIIGMVDAIPPQELLTIDEHLEYLYEDMRRNLINALRPPKVGRTPTPHNKKFTSHQSPGIPEASESILQQLHHELSYITAYRSHSDIATAGKFLVLWGYRTFFNNDTEPNDTLEKMIPYLKHDSVDYYDGKNRMMTAVVGLSYRDIQFICENIGISEKEIRDAPNVLDAALNFEQQLHATYAAYVGADSKHHALQDKLFQTYMDHFGTRTSSVLQLLGIDKKTLQKKLAWQKPEYPD